jgi:hypothetical protein
LAGKIRILGQFSACAASDGIHKTDHIIRRADFVCPLLTQRDTGLAGTGGIITSHNQNL